MSQVSDQMFKRVSSTLSDTAGEPEPKIAQALRALPRYTTPFAINFKPIVPSRRMTLVEPETLSLLPVR